MAFSTTNINASATKTVNARPEMSTEDFTLVLSYVHNMEEYDRDNLLGSFSYLALSSIANAVIQVEQANTSLEEVSEVVANCRTESKQIGTKLTERLDSAQAFADAKCVEYEAKIELAAYALSITAETSWPTIEQLNKIESTNFGTVPSEAMIVAEAISDCKHELASAGIYNTTSIDALPDSIRADILDRADVLSKEAAATISRYEGNFENVVAKLYDGQTEFSLESTLSTDLFWHADIVFCNLEDNIDFCTKKKRNTYVQKTQAFWQDKIDATYHTLGLIAPILKKANNIDSEVTIGEHIDHGLDR